MKVLAIETSCDDTSVAVIENSIVKSNIISSQNFHGKYGGIVPELASRAHAQVISEITNTALEDANTNINDIELIAVTTQPGLVGSLLVGANFAKGLAIRYNIPVMPVNHIEGHIFSGNLQENNIEFPLISLVVSGGHTSIFLVNSYTDYKVLGSTVDDAAGEAFDKIAKLLGLEYPGGPLIDKLAKKGNKSAYDFPRSMINSKNYNFSFSGLKTSVRYFLQKEFENGIPEELFPDIAASAQAAIVDVLTSKTIKAAEENNCNTIVIGGGVSANSGLRAKMNEECNKRNIDLTCPEIEYCVDNAAMIAFIAEKKFQSINKEQYQDLSFTVNSTRIRG